MKRGSVQQRAARGGAVGIVALAVNLGQAFVQVPVLLHYWSAETYGLWGSLLAVTGLAISLDAGHQTYLGNRFCEQWVKEPAQLRHELASGIRAAAVLAVLELFIAGSILLAGGLAWFGVGAVHTSQAAVVGALALYLAYWAVFGAVGGILVRLYPPGGLFARGQWLGIISRLVAFGSLIVAAALGGSVLEAMATQILAGTVFNLFLFRDVRRQFPDLIPWWRGGSWRTAWRNLQTSLVLTANGVIEQLAANGLILLVGNLLNPISVALFTTVRTVANIGLQGSTIMLTPLAPDLVRYHVKGEGNKLVSVFSTSWLLGTSLVTAGLTVGVLVVEPLYTLWTRGAMPLDRLLFTFLGAAVAVRQWAAPFQTYLASLNRLREQSLMAGVRAVLGLGLAVLLLPQWGLPAAGLGALTAEVGAAIVAVVAVRPQLWALGAEFPRKAALCSLIQIIAAMVVWVCYARGVAGWPVGTAISLGSIAVLAWWQWQVLPKEVQERLLGLLRRPAVA